jgi:guanosine-3',5'-bis(diphosphate) 3'-pyrophosphohydrolase
MVWFDNPFVMVILGVSGGFFLEHLLKAVQLAVVAHSGQQRKRKGGGGAPYVVHPLACAERLAELGMDEVTVAAAVLHDVVEDTPVTLNGVRHVCGSATALLVDELTSPDHLEGIEERKAWQVEHAPGMSLQAKCIKAADQLDNVRSLRTSPPPWSLDRKERYLEGCENVVRALAHGPFHAVLETLADEFNKELSLTRVALYSED